MMKLFSILTLVVIAAGCATSSGVGRLAEVESKAYKKIGAEYDKGSSEADTGEKLIAKGRKMTENGRKIIRKGEGIIEEGNRLIKRSRDQYSAATNYVKTPESPSEIQADTKELVRIGKRWKEGIEQVKRGNNLIADGTQKIGEGEATIREGRSQVEYGKSLMREAERAYNTKKPGFTTYSE